MTEDVVSSSSLQQYELILGVELVLRSACPLSSCSSDFAIGYVSCIGFSRSLLGSSLVSWAMLVGFPIWSSIIDYLVKLHSWCAGSCQRWPSGPSFLCLMATCWVTLEVSRCCHRHQLWTCCFLTLLHLPGFLIYAWTFLYRSNPWQYLSESISPL